MDPVVELLYDISNALELPVMLALLTLLAWAVLQAGKLLREYFDTRAHRRAKAAAVADLKKHGSGRVSEIASRLETVHGPCQALIRAIRAHPENDLVAAKVLDDIHIRMNERTNRLSMGIRLGPMFGLMGTLIPMGPALTGLAAGDINVLAQNLVVAFTTTVLGLVVGGTCYVLQFTRRRWYTRELSDLDFLHNMMIANRKETNAATNEGPTG
jgi:biopolymer transport protein ExbB/TolQ